MFIVGRSPPRAGVVRSDTDESAERDDIVLGVLDGSAGDAPAFAIG